MTTLAAPLRIRDGALDKLRGLAIALMMVDHVLELTGTGHPIRYTVTRLSMPLFFVVGGHLAGSRLRRRHLDIFVIGLVLPLVIPWIDRPNVLVWYAIGCACLRSWDRAPGLMVGWVLVALTMMANSFNGGWGPQTYNPVAVVALMFVGRLLPRGAFTAGSVLPGWLGLLGRFPLSLYVGHLVVLEVLREMVM